MVYLLRSNVRTEIFTPKSVVTEWTAIGRKTECVSPATMGLSCCTRVFFAVRLMLILDLLEMRGNAKSLPRVLMQEYYTVLHGKKSEKTWSKMKQTQVMYLSVSGLCSTLSLALTAAPLCCAKTSDVTEEVPLFNTLKFPGNKTENFIWGDFYLKRVH